MYLTIRPVSVRNTGPDDERRRSDFSASATGTVYEISGVSAETVGIGSARRIGPRSACRLGRSSSPLAFTLPGSVASIARPAERSRAWSNRALQMPESGPKPLRGQMGAAHSSVLAAQTVTFASLIFSVLETLLCVLAPKSPAYRFGCWSRNAGWLMVKVFEDPRVKSSTARE